MSEMLRKAIARQGAGLPFRYNGAANVKQTVHSGPTILWGVITNAAHAQTIAIHNATTSADTATAELLVPAAQAGNVVTTPIYLTKGLVIEAGGTTANFTVFYSTA